MSEMEELFWFTAFIAGCVVLLLIVLANIGADHSHGGGISEGRSVA
jgi:hypothetical protein